MFPAGGVVRTEPEADHPGAGAGVGAFGFRARGLVGIRAYDGAQTTDRISGAGITAVAAQLESACNSEEPKAPSCSSPMEG